MLILIFSQHLYKGSAGRVHQSSFGSFYVTFQRKERGDIEPTVKRKGTSNSRYDYKGEIKSRVSMIDALNRYGIEINRHGYINCPFHSEKTASCKIYEDINVFKCYGCGEKGDVIQFISRLHNVKYTEAYKIINADFGLNMPFERAITLSEKRSSRQRTEHRQTEYTERLTKQDAAYEKYLDCLSDYEKVTALIKQYEPFNKADREQFRSGVMTSAELESKMQAEPHPIYISAINQKELIEFKLDEAESELKKCL